MAAGELKKKKMLKSLVTKGSFGFGAGNTEGKIVPKFNPASFTRNACMDLPIYFSI